MIIIKKILTTSGFIWLLSFFACSVGNLIAGLEGPSCDLATSLLILKWDSCCLTTFLIGFVKLSRLLMLMGGLPRYFKFLVSFTTVLDEFPWCPVTLLIGFESFFWWMVGLDVFTCRDLGMASFWLPCGILQSGFAGLIWNGEGRDTSSICLITLLAGSAKTFLRALVFIVGLDRLCCQVRLIGDLSKLCCFLFSLEVSLVGLSCGRLILKSVLYSFTCGLLAFLAIWTGFSDVCW